MEILSGFGFVVLFSLSAFAGTALRDRLFERHLTKDNLDAIRLVTGLLVTFAALVLSLELSTSRAGFDNADRNRSLYAANLARLDHCLADLGGQDEVRRMLRAYTAAVIASTWPHEPAPTVPGMPDVAGMAVRGEDPHLSALMNTIGLAVESAAAPTPAAANTAARCREDYRGVQQSRWAVIEDAQQTSGTLFIVIISFWLALVFLSFGLQIPQRRLAGIVLGIGVLCVASVMFVIVDLGVPYGGLFGIRSTAMRQSLADMIR